MSVTTNSIVENLDIFIDMYTQWKDKDLLLEAEETKRRVLFYPVGLEYKTALQHIMNLSTTSKESFKIAREALNK